MIAFIGHVSKDVRVRNQAGKRRYRNVLSDTFISISTANIIQGVVQYRGEEMIIDFSSVNLPYLIRVRDIA